MDISQILSSLSADDMKNLQDLAASVLSGADSGSGSTSAPPTEQSLPGGIDLNMLGNMASVMSAFTAPSNDPRCQLIMSLKPLLSEDRRKRADEAVKIIKLIDMLPVLRDSGLFKGLQL